jgi:hypothetical protein
LGIEIVFVHGLFLTIEDLDRLIGDLIVDIAVVTVFVHASGLVLVFAVLVELSIIHGAELYVFKELAFLVEFTFAEELVLVVEFGLLVEFCPLHVIVLPFEDDVIGVLGECCSLVEVMFVFEGASLLNTAGGWLSLVI